MEEPNSSKHDITTQQKIAGLRKGLIEYCVMLICAEEPVYTGDIVKKLHEVDMIVVEGTLYPLLSRLRKEGDLTYEWIESDSGPPRKYYQLTVDGHTTLKAYHKQWKSLSKTIKTLKKGSEA